MLFVEDQFEQEIRIFDQAFVYYYKVLMIEYFQAISFDKEYQSWFWTHFSNENLIDANY